LATRWCDRKVLPKPENERKIAKNLKTNFMDSLFKYDILSIKVVKSRLLGTKYKFIEYHKHREKIQMSAH
jgi:hypothetical protein